MEEEPRSPGSQYNPRTDGSCRIAPAIASLYDPGESSSPVGNFAASSYPTCPEIASERAMPVRRGHSSAFAPHHDDDALHDEEVTDIDVVVAEQWVACVHCAGDNPPHAHRCELCFGSLTGIS